MDSRSAGPPLAIRRFRADDIPAIERLNSRLEAGQVGHRVYPERLGDRNEEGVSASRLLVAAEGNEIRGGVWLQDRQFRIGGADVTATWVKYPVTESLVDPAFGGVPGGLLWQIMRERPKAMALGMGGLRGRFAQLLRQLGWTGSDVPFLFHVTRPNRVLSHLAYARSTRARRVALDVAAGSGLGWLAGQAHRAVCAAWSGLKAPVLGGVEPTFGAWADEIWVAARDAYGFAAARPSAQLNLAYPGDAPGLDRLVVRGKRNIGWACTLTFDFRTAPDRRYFGPLVVGVLADCFAAPSDAPLVVRAATRHLAAAGVDLIVANLSHPAWVRGAFKAGYLPGPSNFAFYRSPAIGKLLGTAGGDLHLTRGDCDGPRWVS